MKQSLLIPSLSEKKPDSHPGPCIRLGFQLTELELTRVFPAPELGVSMQTHRPGISGTLSPALQMRFPPAAAARARLPSRTPRPAPGTCSGPALSLSRPRSQRPKSLSTGREGRGPARSHALTQGAGIPQTSPFLSRFREQTLSSRPSCAPSTFRADPRASQTASREPAEPK